MSAGVHDIGGLLEEFGPLDTREWGYHLWEMQVHAVLVVLTRQARLGLTVQNQISPEVISSKKVSGECRALQEGTDVD